MVPRTMPRLIRKILLRAVRVSVVKHSPHSQKCSNRARFLTAVTDTFNESPETDSDSTGPEDDGHFHFTATKTQTQRIDQFLTNRISYLSRTQFKN